MKLKHVVLIGVVSSIMSYLNNNLEVYGEDSERQEQLLEDIRNLVNDKLEKFDVDGCLEGLNNDVPEHIEKAKEVASDITESLIQELNGIIASFTSIKNEVMEEQDTEETAEVTEEVTETPFEETKEESLDNVSEEAVEDEEEAKVSVLEVPNDAFEDLIKTIEIKEEDEEAEEDEEDEEENNKDDDEVRNSLIAELEQLVREIDLETSEVNPIAEENVEESLEVAEEEPVEELTQEPVEAVEDEIDEKESIIADLEKFLAFNLDGLNCEEDAAEAEETVECNSCNCAEKDDGCDVCEAEETCLDNESDVCDACTCEDNQDYDIFEEVKEEDLDAPEEEITDQMLENFSEDDYLSAIQDAINSSIILDENGEALELGDVFDEEYQEDDKKEISKDEIDEIFAEILNQEKPEEVVEDEETNIEDEETNVEETETVEASDETEDVEEVEDEIIEEDENSNEEVEDEITCSEDDYLDNLIDQLNSALNEENDEVEETTPEEPVAETPDLYSQINELYPYLSRGFVRAVYDLKETIARDYPIGRGIIILHRISFDDLNNLRQFAEIVLSHDYRVNVDEKQMIVDILKECKNTDGKILTNIFEIANQASLLGGVYEGYRVEIVD